MAKKTTSRGFRIYCTITDLNSSEVRVQESSLATEPAVWIFTHNRNPALQGDPHLSVTQARRVIRALKKFIDGK